LERLELAMPERGSVDARVYDASGRQIRLIASGELEPGRHLVEWNANDETGASVGSGIYFARMIVQGRSYTTRFALMR
jgi:flagellar hook assembly protein FlgD